MAGLYVHIPFCASRCIYCGFYSTTLGTDARHDYVSALGKELTLRRNYLDGLGTLRTIYIGGGTPSQLPCDEIKRLFSYIYNMCRPNDLKEVTFEANPDDMTPELAYTLRECGVNRVSMGAQSFDDNRLRFLHRRHTADEVHRAVETLRGSGMTNLSIDLIYGFPGQTVEEWDKDITCAIGLDVSHVSAYSLMYDEGTPLHSLLRQGKVKEIDEDVSVAMYNRLVERMKAAGFEHYEVSNFARHGMRALHNSSYWNDTPYMGIGAAAHSYDRKSRQWNVADIRAYVKAINNGTVPAEKETIDADTHYNDLITTALRTADGLDMSLLDSEHSTFMLRCAKNYLDNGQLRIADNHLSIAPDSVFVSDMIMSDLMKV